MPVLPVCYLGPGGIEARDRTRCLVMINQIPTSAGETGMEISIQSGDET
jgi:hypothetical protein